MRWQGAVQGGQTTIIMRCPTGKSRQIWVNRRQQK
jgi:hypothetical protein